jgi:hypothetical protein
MNRNLRWRGLLAVAVLASVSAVRAGEAPQTQPTQPLYAADTRPAIFINFAPRDSTPENPQGHQRDWLNAQTAEKWMRSQLARGDRIIVRTPFGNGIKGWVTSKQWHVAVGWRREMFIRVLNQWLGEDPRRTFSLYIGTLVGDPDNRAMTETRSPAPDDPVAMKNFLATVRPWLGATKIHRLWLDHSSGPPQNLQNVVKLARWCRTNLDLVVGMEAYPRTGKALDLETMRQLPTLATWRFPETFDKPGHWTIPAGYEALLIVIPQKRSPPPTREALAAYRRRGFSIGSGHRDFDRMVEQVNVTVEESRP